MFWCFFTIENHGGCSYVVETTLSLKIEKREGISVRYALVFQYASYKLMSWLKVKGKKFIFYRNRSACCEKIGNDFVLELQ